MLLFVDESGHDRREMPCEVLAGVAIAEARLWDLVQAIRGAEQRRFGASLRSLLSSEVKATKLLKRKRFKSANLRIDIPDSELPPLAHAALVKGRAASDRGDPRSEATQRELVAYSRSVLLFVHDVLDIASAHEARVIASVVDGKAPRPAPGRLRKDYVYLLERYFYLLETLPPRERGLVVFDELEKSQAHILLQQMAAYFLQASKGRYRSSRIVPEPFFVHSELTTGIFIADLTAYVLGWAWPRKMKEATGRDELKPFSRKLHAMQFQGQAPDPTGTRSWPIYGIKWIDDLRGSQDRDSGEL
jgi:hypothetical protein